ncbi:MAG TPA: O-antigen ligase family protein [Solirubrobacteraceae bacterium]|nr:O-antigen ligase family protein [Solirubrobacteraceae bacterium]
MSTHAALEDQRRVGALSVPTPAVQTLLTAGLAAFICAIAFVADGGLQIGRTTRAELALILGGGAAVATALLLAPRRERIWGIGPLALLLALAALTALSITWAASPAEAWLETNRTLAYAAAFAGAAALAHAVPGRWSAVVGAIALSAVAISAYAVLTKVLPGALSPDETYARLREPFGYWNSVGLAAALGVPACLWLGTRRTGHQALNALAYPALGLLVLTMLLSFSRGAVLAGVCGAAFWIATVPRRLRATAVLLAGVAGGGLIAAWAFSQSALTDDRVPVELRNQAGLQLGLLLVVMLGLLTLAGLWIGFARATRTPSTLVRDRAGVALLAALALVPVGGAIALALGERGLTGSISARWEQLTDPSAPLPRNDNSRLTAAGSVRARYWDEALRIFADNPGAGVGAGGYAIVRKRYRTADPAVRHAHGYVVQTLADLGLAGLAVSLALLAAWLASAVRATGLRRRDRGRPFTPERIGLLTLFAVVIVFGVHSFVDWTWFVPANAAVALLAAGWIAGRGPLGRGAARAAAPRAAGAPGGLRERLRAGLGERARASCAAAALLIALTAAWTAWQPLRADTAAQDALDKLDAGNADAARAQARDAREINPLSLDPLYTLATIESAAGRRNAARRALERAVRLQPSNPDPWLRLAEFELNTLRRPKVALTAIRPALYLDPRSSDAVAVFLAAQRQITEP